MSEEHFSVVRGYLAVNEDVEEPLEVPELFPVKKPQQLPKAGQEEPLEVPRLEDLYRKRDE